LAGSKQIKIQQDDVWELMIIKEMVQNNNKIRIETAVNADDAEKNNFNNGEYSRFFVNDKKVNYGTLIQYMIKETYNNRKSFTYDRNEIIKQRNEILKENNAALKKKIIELKKKYTSFGYSDDAISSMDEMIEKIDEYGVRIS